MMRKINKKGVSLPEMLAIVVIMGLIAVITIPLVGKTIDNAKRKVHLGDAITIVDQVRSYCAANEDDEMNYICNTDTEGENKSIVIEHSVDITSNAAKGWYCPGGAGMTFSNSSAPITQADAKADIDEFEESLSNSLDEILGVNPGSDYIGHPAKDYGIWVKKSGDKILIRMVGKDFQTGKDMTWPKGFIDPLDNTKSTKEKIFLDKDLK